MTGPRFQLSELLEQVRQKKLSIGELVQRLGERGPVLPSLHTVELKQLDDALGKKTLDAQLHRLLGAKLRQVQEQARPAAPASGDATVVNAAATPAGEATVVNPAAAAPAGAGPEVLDLGFAGTLEEKTQVAGGASETTAFTPTVQRSTQTGPHTAGRSGPTTGSWERLAQAPAPQEAVHPGMMLKERFYLEKEVGRGGMGVVYKARDERKVEAQDKNPWVAVKILNDEFRQHPQALISLQREARKAQQLTHDNILRVYDFDKAGTIVYMTMEYADGGTVKDFIKKVAAKGGIPYAEARPVIEGMARGLARAHRDNIVHSDFKPGNVMLMHDLTPKIFDLGIARAAKSGGGKQGETTVFDAGDLGALTPAYASLEMIRGQDPEPPDDIYALGISAYECLTGKHPYNKKNAEDAFKAGMKPARIKGLTNLQWKTLEKALAFERKNRIKTCEEFLEGMRPRTAKDYAVPVSVGGFALILLAVVSTWVLQKLEERRVSAMVAQFEQGAFADHEQALNALNAMDPEERAQAMLQGAKPVQDYFFKLAAQKWNVPEKRYQYQAADTVLSSVAQLYPDSAAVKGERDRIESEKDQQLAALDEQYTARRDARRLFEDQPENVPETLAIVRQIDPRNALLSPAENSGLVLAYKDAVQQALRSQDLDAADKRLATALKIFPQSDQLKSIASDLQATRDAQLARARQAEMLEAARKMTPEQARDKLKTLLASAAFTPEWQAEVEMSLIPVSKDAAPETAQLKAGLAEVYAKHAAGQIDQKSYTAAQLTVDSGMKMFGGAPMLMQEKGRLETAMAAIQKERLAQEAAARIQDFKRTFDAKTKANDVKGAEVALAQLRKDLPAGDAFLATEAPKALGETYQRMAERAAGQKNFRQAYALVASGLKTAPNLESLKALEPQYRLESEVATLNDAAARPETANGDQLKAAAAFVKAQDAKRHAEASDDVFKRIQSMMTTNPTAAAKAQAEWKKVFPENEKLAALTVPQAAILPGTAAPPKRVPRVAGVETCLLDYAGYGSKSRATCADTLPYGEGPKLVVVPGLGGSAAFAITKYEITVDQFNAFCKATGKCQASDARGDLPRTNITHTQARTFAEWMTENSGFTYRVPTAAEWTHAATAAGQGTGEDFNCVLMQGSTQIKGGVPIAVKSGRPNPWGLVNAVGNVSEWVEAPGGPVLRGANFNVPLSRCTADWSDSGGGETAGLRLVREIGGQPRG